MEKPKEHNLRNIQEIFEAKTGVELRKKRHFCRPVRKAALLAAVLALLMLTAAFTYPLFSPLDGDALTLSAAYAGNGIVDFAYFKELLEQYRYTGCLVLHGLHEECEFEKAVSFINGVFGEDKA